MGRVKRKPIKLSKGHDEVLGRKALPQASSLEHLHWMITEEVVVPDRLDITEELNDLVDSDEDDRGPRKKRKRLQKGKKCKAKKSKKRNTKHVTFADEKGNSIIPRPEASFEKDDTTGKISLYVDGEWSQDTTCQAKEVRCSIASHVAVVLGRTLSTTADEKIVRTWIIPIRSRSAVLAVIQCTGNENLTAARYQLARAVVQDHTILISLRHISINEWQCCVSLADNAFQLARDLPIDATASKRRSRRWQPIANLHQCLAALHPDSVVEDVIKEDHGMPFPSDEVYALTDNVQLLASRNDDTKSLAIPNLKPKLRSYQECAVRWMLKREKEPLVCTEWKLLWFALSSGKVIPLQAWRSTISPKVLFNPFSGSLATAVDDAKAQTLTASGFTRVRGGILAESMGLGKTVEVLACILGNQRKMVSQDVSFNRNPSAKRKLCFADSVASDAKPSSDDWKELGDDETDSDSEASVQEAGDVSTSKPQPKRSIIVTPDHIDATIEDVWYDEEEIGSCICSRIITFSNAKDTIVLCERCREPMHLQCAAFQSAEEMTTSTTPLNLRQRFTNTHKRALLCSASICPCCFPLLERRIESAATLIVTPAAILNQWEREIHRHTERNGEPLSVLVYDGVQRTSMVSLSNKSSKVQQLHARNIAGADVVLVTFDALRADIGHSDDNLFVGSESEGALRRPKRYRVVPSPLLGVDWWRLCLDEAQQVETPTAGSARMAAKIVAHNRWCVSGTPIGKGRLDDLYGLFLFLRLEPFDNIHWFKRCFNTKNRDIRARVSALLKDVFWRSTKSLQSVQRDMDVPDQVDETIELDFSSIERHFYRQQLEKTLRTASEVSDKKKFNKRDSDILTEHLHMLRAACCHPQVGSRGICNSTRKSDAGLGNRVMTMGQILDRFIDDAKQKCEESQRLVVMHTNAMAAITKLKIEAKTRGVPIASDDAALLQKCCALYEEALEIAEKNARPALAVGSVEIVGSTGFSSLPESTAFGSYLLEWKGEHRTGTGLMANLDFKGSAKKITCFEVRLIDQTPDWVKTSTSRDFSWKCVMPSQIVLQVADTALEGKFVDVCTVDCKVTEAATGALEFKSGDIRTNKSKTWRIILRETESCYHEDSSGFYTGMHLSLYEADIANDPIQRLHCLHNACLAYSDSVNLHKNASRDELDVLTSKLKLYEEEARKIESLYMAVPKAKHLACCQRFDEDRKSRIEKEIEFLHLFDEKKCNDIWEAIWWDDFLVLVRLNGTDAQQKALCDRVLQDMDTYMQSGNRMTARDGIIPFTEFADINGLRTALALRISGIRTGIGGRSKRTSQAAILAKSQNQQAETNMTAKARHVRFCCPVGAHGSCMSKLSELSPTPSEEELFENSHCKICKADWYQTGEMCRHCKIGESLEDLAPDRVTLLLLRSIAAVIRSPLGSNIIEESDRQFSLLGKKSSKFFDVVEAEAKERRSAWIYWRTHLDLLNDLDELKQSKSSMRLSYDGERLDELQEDQLNAIVVPMDVQARYHDHAAKQALTMGDLKRSQDTLRYLKNLVKSETTETDEDKCVVCLSSFGSERAVLRCGHAFHMTPCLDRIIAHSGKSIACPLRCRVRTSADDVMIASTRRNDDGTKLRRINGNWGTKVTRIVGDILDVRDCGEKGIVFSQWEDMLDIVEAALQENNVSFIRANGLRQIGKSTERFIRQRDCTVLLLNVKNGAEGLTIVEATQVFMVEPLLNNSLDFQAISRVHRIGQKKRTHVHRYIVRDTVETKIEKWRTSHSGEANASRLCAIRAGGIDGGFRSQEELLSILQPDS